MLEELAKYISIYRSGAKFILYQIIQPQITSYAIYRNGNIQIAINLLTERCKQLKKLSFHQSIYLPTQYFTQFFKHFEYLLYLNINGSMMDDNGFNSLAKYPPQ
uniref:Uncharacterized protein n=1 Tax=Lepeophtheirus salmonis TaxID=72036 RepID=A0A0K2UU99_LEPSM